MQQINKDISIILLMAGDPQLIEYFAQCPELSFYSVAQVFKSVGFDSVLFVCVSCRGVIKGKV